MPQPSIPLEVLEELDILDTSPQVVYLLEWAAKKLDMTKVSSQTDLTRWLRETMEKESERLGIDLSDYRKRFKGMIKFFTQPDLGLKTIAEIQTKIAENIVEDITEGLKTARDYEEIRELKAEYKDVELPPMAPAELKRQFQRAMNRIDTYISRVRSHRLYPRLLRELGDIRRFIETGRYKEVPTPILRRYLFRSTRLFEMSNEIQRSLNLPFTVLRPTIEKYHTELRRELVRRLRL